MPVTIRDVAHSAGVSYTTVSLAFQAGSRISGERRRQILRIAGELGYTPNIQARALRSRRTRTLGLLVADLTNPFYALMSRAAQDAAAEAGFEVLVADSQWDVARELRELRRMVSARVDGILACMGPEAGASHRLLEQSRVPHLALDAVSTAYPGAYVANDIAAAVRLGINHLVVVGCRRLACFNGGSALRRFSAFELMESEFRLGVASHGLHGGGGETVFDAGLTIDSGRRACDAIRASGIAFDGVFCANTLCAIGFMEEAARKGIRVPEDVAVIGIDDLDVCSLDCVSLTSIRQPYVQLTKLATELLISALEKDEQPNVQLMLRPELVIRRSTKRQN